MFVCMRLSNFLKNPERMNISEEFFASLSIFHSQAQRKYFFFFPIQWNAKAIRMCYFSSSKLYSKSIYRRLRNGTQYRKSIHSHIHCLLYMQCHRWNRLFYRFTSRFTFIYITIDDVFKMILYRTGCCFNRRCILF